MRKLCIGFMGVILVRPLDSVRVSVEFEAKPEILHTLTLQKTAYSLERSMILLFGL